ncbi:MAG: methionine--tRNA ligase [Planctomycetota bacterium]
MSAQTYYITTPIYYVNDKPHIGHCYSTLLADCLARSMRLAGRDTFFLTGTDEHADKVATSAQENGVTTLEWADRNAAAFRAAFEELRFSNDDFIRTTEPRHTQRVQAFIEKLLETGDVELGDYSGWYDPSQEEYVTENTAREHDYTSPVSGKPLVQRTEQNYFFRLSRYADKLQHLIESTAEKGTPFIRPEARQNEVLGRIKAGLQDVPISRAVKDDDPASGWGIRMPGDDKHRVYVWIDALFNYLSTVDTEERRRYWPADVHVIGKDILWFHAVIWPCLLMALGEKLPGYILAHSWWIREGRKMSKSLGNFIDLPTMRTYSEAFGDDAVRWYLLTQGPLGATDADFAHDKFIETYNTDLANGIGNAFSRVSNMIAKYFNGACPAPGDEGADIAALTTDIAQQTIGDLDAGDVAGALHNRGLLLSNRIDAFIHATEPFKLAKDPANMAQVGAILYTCAETLRIAAILLTPAMPDRMAELLRRLGQPVPDGHGVIRDDAGSALPLAELCTWGRLQPGTTISKGDALFPRADADAPPPAA